ncbi:uncharacterized protein PHACADRAFT_261027 [Phanerochaete carnosa HHB-10118-sp]|uniref:Uncharacterized protein n=1 Tax=Phanerochaete carnosa (strain HHB-10118-sp) TaxID=650164 RepID=K5VM66_PHACS|nr:uncharacterized protein PHACADRAFT_261027 [Phanerochaete carnosa HHB-10118-sp]EKM52538.1 hypothetical protein PHACADRAFT_261027 [Phanerochaete carnosa HHB-10118-sp]
MQSTADYVLIQSGDDWEYAPSYAAAMPMRQRKKESSGERYVLLCAAALAMASLSFFSTVVLHIPQTLVQ